MSGASNTSGSTPGSGLIIANLMTDISAMEQMLDKHTAYLLSLPEVERKQKLLLSLTYIPFSHQNTSLETKRKQNKHALHAHFFGQA